MLQPYYYYSPMSIYSLKHGSIEAMPNKSKIVVPGDGTNMDRSLKMLRDAGLITLGEKKGIFYTKLDIVQNPKNVEIIEAEITTTARSAQDVDAVIAVAFIAKSAGIDPNKYLFRAQDFSEFMHRIWATQRSDQVRPGRSPAFLNVFVTDLVYWAIETYPAILTYPLPEHHQESQINCLVVSLSYSSCIE